MSKYFVEWVEETLYRIPIEADSEAEARNKFWEFEYNVEDVKEYDAEVQDGIHVWEDNSEPAN